MLSKWENPKIEQKILMGKSNEDVQATICYIAINSFWNGIAELQTYFLKSIDPIEFSDKSVKYRF